MPTHKKSVPGHHTDTGFVIRDDATRVYVREMLKRTTPIALLALLIFPLGGCDDSAPGDEMPMSAEDESEDVEPAGQEASLPEGLDPSLLPVLETRIVARVAIGGAEVLFIEREPMPGEGDVPIIDMAETGSRDAEDVVEPLREQGATPLEILRALQPEVPLPDSLVADHERIALSAGRDPAEIRVFTEFRDGMNITFNSDICPNSFPNAAVSQFLFNEHVQNIANGAFFQTRNLILNDSTPLSARSILLGASQNSGNNVAVRVCNPPRDEHGGCSDDRFHAYVVTYGPAGSGTAWHGKIDDCRLLKYWWGKQVAGQFYAVIVDKAERRYQGAAWYPCLYGSTCESHYAYLGLAIKG